MKRRLFAGVLAVLALAVTAQAADAQRSCRGRDCDHDRDRDRYRRRTEVRRAYNPIPLSVEVRLDGGIPTGDDSEGLDNGLGWGVTGALDLTPVFSIYAGYSSFEFEQDDEFLEDEEVEDSGFDLGGRVSLGYGSMWSPFAQFGAIFHDDDTGLEVGLGGNYGLGRNLALTPMVRYRTIGDLDYVTLGAGLNLRF